MADNNKQRQTRTYTMVSKTQTHITMVYSLGIRGKHGKLVGGSTGEHQNSLLCYYNIHSTEM